jgi:hypothetical protein
MFGKPGIPLLWVNHQNPIPGKLRPALGRLFSISEFPRRQKPQIISQSATYLFIIFLARATSQQAQ